MTNEKWKRMKERQRADRLQEAIDKGHIDPEELAPGYVEIPEEPDPNWTDEPMTKTIISRRERSGKEPD